MENDQDIRDLGKRVETVVQSKAVQLGIKAVVAANPGYAAVLSILKELTVLVAGFLKENGDDELFRTEGTFLKGYPVPYHINRSYELGNDFATLNLNLIPLLDHNGQGPAPKSLPL